MDVCKTSRSHERIHCEVCGKTFRLRAQLNAHLRSHTDEKPFKSDNCGKSFKYTWNLNKHKREQCSQKIVPHEKSSVPDSKLPPKFKCPICFHVFKYSYNRTRHLRQQCLNEYMKKGKGKIEHGVDTSSKKTNKAYNCSYCPHSFRFPNNLKLHERAHLMKPACGKCGRVFTRKNYRNGHEKQCQGKQNKTDTEKETGTGTNEKGKFKQKCPQCFKCFRSSSFLQRHLSLHSKETAYACMHCGQKFDSQDQYLQHECKFCTKSFLRARYLRRHILTHTEVKPYRCKTCESCFSRYDHLKLHQARCRGKRQLEVRVVKISLDSLSTSPQSKTQEDGDMLQCKVCSKRLSTPSDLKRHMSIPPPR
uniref:Uncharacterized LOC107593629 n=1 Tax=Sinocyclocheilus grahami TaxID=75366 RepID=A0A672S964_SINGR